jgi:hypothetical protein
MILCFALEEALEYYACERLTVAAAIVTNMIRSRKKPDRCLECGSWRIAGILYGMPSMDRRLDRDLEAGRVVVGGRTKYYPIIYPLLSNFS